MVMEDPKPFRSNLDLINEADESVTHLTLHFARS